MLQRPERNDLLEEIERRVSIRSMGERRHRRCAWPRDNGREEDAKDERALDAVKH